MNSEDDGGGDRNAEMLIATMMSTGMNLMTVMPTRLLMLATETLMMMATAMMTQLMR